MPTLLFFNRNLTDIILSLVLYIVYSCVQRRVHMGVGRVRTNQSEVQSKCLGPICMHATFAQLSVLSTLVMASAKIVAFRYHLININGDMTKSKIEISDKLSKPNCSSRCMLIAKINSCNTMLCVSAIPSLR